MIVRYERQEVEADVPPRHRALERRSVHPRQRRGDVAEAPSRGVVLRQTEARRAADPRRDGADAGRPGGGVDDDKVREHQREDPQRPEPVQVRDEREAVDDVERDDPRLGRAASDERHERRRDRREREKLREPAAEISPLRVRQVVRARAEHPPAGQPGQARDVRPGVPSVHRRVRRL